MDKGGNGNSNNTKLKEAVKSVDGFTTATSDLGNFQVDGVEGLFNNVARALQKFIGYNSGTRELKGNGIGRNPGYTSSYTNNARLNVVTSPLYLFMSSMGFKPSTELQNKHGSEVAVLLKDDFSSIEDLKKAPKTEYTYTGFLKKFEEQYGKDKLNTNAISCPLYALHLASTAYFRFKFKENQGTIDPFDKIKARLESMKASFSRMDPDLEDVIDNFLIDIVATTPPNFESLPSPVAPLAGTLTTLTAAGGGAAAAYILNLGGTKTLTTSSLDCPSNLKEAIDWALRVTGKDGGGGQDGTNGLTTQVKELLGEVEVSDTGLSQQEFDKVTQALTPAGSGGLIAKLAEGLQQFIGYENGNSNGTPKITGGGILPANVARHQVCNAVLNFVIRFLEGLSEINIESPNKHGVSKVIATLRKCMGTGQVPQRFGKLVDEIGKKVGEGFDSKINHTTNGQTGKLNNVFSALKGITDQSFSSEDQTHNVEYQTQNVRNSLDAVNDNVTPDGSSKFKNLNESIAKLFGDVKTHVTSQPSDTTHLSTSTLTNFKNVKPDSINGDINKLKTNNTFKDYANAAVFTAVRDAATAFIAELQTITYTSFYDKAKWSKVSSDDERAKCARIFLGCLPLYYQALTYIYWGCHDNGGRWRNLTLGGGALRSYFDSQGLLSPYVDTNKRGAHIAESALKGFSEFSQGMSGASSSSPFTYSTFTKELQTKVGQNADHLSTECPLSALFYGASYYFRCQHIKNAKEASKSPKTIREMLYFLAALQFSPQYDAFDSYVTEYFKGIVPNSKKSTPDAREDHELKLQVADSGITSKPGSPSSSDTLSAADVKSYLASTFHLAPAFIGLIQEPSTSGEPWLHSLFTNSQFNLSIPSFGAGIFSALSNYAYSLQFQLHFLYQQCNNTYTKACGWNQCRFGQGVNASFQNKVVQSHICPTGCTNTIQHRDGNHSQGGCQHANCGTTKASPLQAFLTDNLPGFCRKYPGSAHNHFAFCSGSLCHVPMGFKAEDLRSGSSANTQGENICLNLRAFCGGFNTPLRQLSEKFGCLTKRTPRTLGDLFGFTWHLNGQMFKSAQIIDKLKSALNPNYNSVEDFIAKVTQALPSLQPSPQESGLVKSLQTMASIIPFLYQFLTVNADVSLPVTLFNLKGTNHNAVSPSQYSGHHNDLYSLFNSDCSNPNTCGKYLYPLTHSDGATFAPTHASTYLSWVLYLSDDLQSWFQEMLDEFKNIDCSKTGCRKSTTGGQQACQTPHAPGTHGNSAACFCDSVVHCGGTLPLLYRHGFRYYSPLELMGGSNKDGHNKRNCAQFAQQLQKVISTEAPLDNLLNTIDTFLYAIRWEFFSKLSAFWSVYVCIILYTFFFLLDTLRVRSHLHFPSSNSIAPVSLLTRGRARALTKLSKLVYFMP
ncbi:variant erythrocyte surface antigen-1 family protein [Babesia caballi]|uniref:Variant erythrocyte surface antigen-1 family protein n=1 Tax=Babesia caballi TaxID=5871 RepID=A0AAV4LX49_BABCB|nr:variant erythrocyte surface antigen-1 family protein [Babesia caballi]